MTDIDTLYTRYCEALTIYIEWMVNPPTNVSKQTSGEVLEALCQQFEEAHNQFFGS